MCQLLNLGHLETTKSNEGQVIDAAMVDGTAALMARNFFQLNPRCDICACKNFYLLNMIYTLANFLFGWP